MVPSNKRKSGKKKCGGVNKQAKKKAGAKTQMRQREGEKKKMRGERNDMFSFPLLLAYLVIRTSTSRAIAAK